MKEAAVIAAAVMLAAIRIAGHKSEAFQAVAHLFVGGLFGASYVWRLDKTFTGDDKSFGYLLVAVSLSVVELICFLFTRFYEVA